MIRDNRLAVIVDGSSLIYRAFFAYRDMKSPDDKPVGALFGFCSMLISLIRNHECFMFCVAMDSGRKTFRSDIYSEYKAHRPPMPEDLREQIPLLGDACDALGVTTVQKTAFEADDLIATFSQSMSAEQIKTRIVGVDKDLMQLINDKVHMYNPVKSQMIYSNDVVEKFGVLPHQMTSFQAIVGDASDNIPGIKGIGPVNATKLLKEYGSLHGIYENIHSILPIKIREKLTNCRDNAELSLKLATLDKHVELDIKHDDLYVKQNYDVAADFLSTFGFQSLIKKLSGIQL